MAVFRVLSRRIPKSTLLMCRRTSILSNYFHFQSPLRTQFQNNNNKVSWPASLLKNHSTLCTTSAFQKCGSEFPQPTKNVTSHTNEYAEESSQASGDTEIPDSSSESETDFEELVPEELSKHDLLDYLQQREVSLKINYSVMEKLKNVILGYDKMEKDAHFKRHRCFLNSMPSLWDVRGTIRRASRVVEKRILKIDASKEISRAVPHLKTVLEAVNLIDKLLTVVTYCEAPLPNGSILSAPEEPTVKETSQAGTEHTESANASGDMEKFFIQNFAISLLDVADTLTQVSVIFSLFSVVDMSKNIEGVMQLLNVLLKDVAMSNNQLTEVFEKFGIKRFVPHDENYNSVKHNAVCLVKRSGLQDFSAVALVRKPGYMHYDRVIRQAEVWVVDTVSDLEDSEAEDYNEADQDGSEAEKLEMIAIQNFAKTLLGIADTLTKASLAYPSISMAEDIAEAVTILKRYLEDVAVADKQLTETFKKFGIVRFFPEKGPFDPHRHIAVDSMWADSDTPCCDVKDVLKPGYMLHNRVIRKAIVWVTKENMCEYGCADEDEENIWLAKMVQKFVGSAV